MPILELPDARIAYDVEPSTARGGGQAGGSGPPIVFLHGVGSNRQTWRAQLEEFSATHTAVAIDARGYGGSWTRPDTVSMARFAADTASVIHAVGGGHAHVCGLSMGGIVGLHLWRDHPQVVLSLVLADTWAWHPVAAAGQDARLAAVDANDMPSLARMRMPAVYGPGASTSRCIGLPRPNFGAWIYAESPLRSRSQPWSWWASMTPSLRRTFRTNLRGWYPARSSR